MYVLMSGLDYRSADGKITQSKTLLFKIGNERGSGSNQICHCKVIDSSEVETGSDAGEPIVQKPDLLTAILKDYVPVDADEEVFFITWDHGSAFGIFRDLAAEVVAVPEPFYTHLEEYPYLSLFWRTALSRDESLKELAQKEAKKGKKLLFQIGHTFYLEIPGVQKKSDFAEKLGLGELLLYKNVDGSYTTKTHQPETSGLTGQPFAPLQVEEAREILHNEELADVLAHWLNGRKVGVLLMMNCWMMNLHTMYSLRKTVQCLVAPQGDIGTPGYNYKNILRYLFNPENLFLSPQDLAVRCVTSSEKKRMRKLSIQLRSDGEDKVDWWKIFAMDLGVKDEQGDCILLSQIKMLKMIISKLVETTFEISDVQTQAEAIEGINLYKGFRLVSYDFTKANINDEKEVFQIDIVNWLYALHYSGLSVRDGSFHPLHSDLKQNIADLVDEIRNNRLLLAQTKGQKTYPPNAAILAYPPTGYGLFFPIYECNSKNLAENIRKDSLLKEVLEAWPRFIRSVYSPSLWRSYVET